MDITIEEFKKDFLEILETGEKYIELQNILQNKMGELTDDDEAILEKDSEFTKIIDRADELTKKLYGIHR